MSESKKVGTLEAAIETIAGDGLYGLKQEWGGGSDDQGEYTLFSGAGLGNSALMLLMKDAEGQSYWEHINVYDLMQLWIPAARARMKGDE